MQSVEFCLWLDQVAQQNKSIDVVIKNRIGQQFKSQKVHQKKVHQKKVHQKSSPVHQFTKKVHPSVHQIQRTRIVLL